MVILRGRCSICRYWGIIRVVPRIENDVAYVTRSTHASYSVRQALYLTKFRYQFSLAGASFGEGKVSLFLAGAILGEGQVSLFVASAILGEGYVSLFVAGAILGEGQASLFVAGAVLAEGQVLFFVAGVVLGEFWKDSQSMQ